MSFFLRLELTPLIGQSGFLPWCRTNSSPGEMEGIAPYTAISPLRNFGRSNGLPALHKEGFFSFSQEGGDAPLDTMFYTYDYPPS